MTLGEIAYTNYCDVVEWKSYNGQDLPKWIDVHAKIKLAWEYAAEALIQEWLSNKRGEVEKSCYDARITICRIH